MIRLSMKYVRFAAHTLSSSTMIFTRYAKTSDSRNESQTENFELPRRAMLNGRQSGEDLKEKPFMSDKAYAAFLAEHEEPGA